MLMNGLFCFILTLAITFDSSLKKMRYNMGKLDKSYFRGISMEVQQH